MRVLVADDDPEMLEMVAGIAKRELGADVERATSGHELLEMLADGDWDLIITDISMPWMTGLQVAHSARAAGLDTPVIVMTALPIDAAQVDELGDHAILLRKPFGLKQLVSAVHHMLRLNHAA